MKSFISGDQSKSATNRTDVQLVRARLNKLIEERMHELRLRNFQELAVSLLYAIRIIRDETPEARSRQRDYQLEGCISLPSR